MKSRLEATRVCLPCILIFTALLAGACNFPMYPGARAPEPTPGSPTEGRTFPIDPVFSDFYNSLGGEAVLGPAISPLNEAGNLKTQYVANALLVFDPQKTPSERYSLAPLGLMLGISAPPVPDPGIPGGLYINGHRIYHEFQSAYQAFGGAYIVGRPLTEAMYDKERGRIDQYFENLGFYRLETDPVGTVRLTAYGAYHCNQVNCSYAVPFNAAPRIRPLLPEPFETQAAWLGLELTGRVVAGPLEAPDGHQEVIFENLVIYADTNEADAQNLFVSFHLFFPAIFRRKPPAEAVMTAPGPGINMYLPLVIINSPRGQEKRLALKLWLPFLTGGSATKPPPVSLRPLPEDVGITPQKPIYRGTDPLSIFYPTEDERGFHIPFLFDDFIRYHGGYEIFGPPITAVFPLNPGIYRQCFRFLCLDFDITDPDNAHLHPAALGIQYQRLTYSNQPPGTLNDTNIQLRVWEAEPFVASGEFQTIYALALRGQTPLPNIELQLHLTQPDGIVNVLAFPVTDKHGQTSLTVSGFAAPSSTLIRYEVCSVEAPKPPVCVQDHYMIWNPP